jgi:hypothetical protein
VNAPDETFIAQDFEGQADGDARYTELHTKIPFAGKPLGGFEGAFENLFAQHLGGFLVFAIVCFGGHFSVV